MTWKIQLTIVINFISSKDAEEECEMHSSSIKVTSYNDANDEPFDNERKWFYFWFSSIDVLPMS